MQSRYILQKSASVLVIFLFLTVAIKAQTVGATTAFPRSQMGDIWEVQIATIPRRLPLKKIAKIAILNESTDAIGSVSIEKPVKTNFGFSVLTKQPLNTFIPAGGTEKKLRDYFLHISLKNDKDEVLPPQIVAITLLDETATVNTVVQKAANNIEDADIYIAGEFNGAHKRKTRYSAAIKLQKTRIQGKWDYSPWGFFKLKASTDPDADPDRMEIGFRFARFFERSSKTFLPATYWDNEVKFENERDFENTNLLYSTKLSFLPVGRPRDKTSKYKVFFRPFIGGEFGKNLLSPVRAAEGDGIARFMGGADLRVVAFLNPEKEEGIEWKTSYTRRWLLTDELGYETDDNGDLQLTRFGKSPRDFVESNFTYFFNKSFGTFIGYEWGQVPPSYKFVDHRFKVGFVFKRKYAVQ